MTTPFICTVCGKVHNERLAFAFNSPYYYHQLSEKDRESMAHLSEDWCVIEHDTQTDHFIRAVLELPIKGTDDTFEYGVWVSLSEKNFAFYMDNFNEDLERTTYFGYLCNQIPDYENTLALKCDVVCGPNGKRPYVFVQDNQDHAFARDFTEGITPDEADRRLHQLLSQ